MNFRLVILAFVSGFAVQITDLYALYTEHNNVKKIFAFTLGQCEQALLSYIVIHPVTMVPGAPGVQNQSVIHPRHPLPHAEPFTLIDTGGTFGLDYDKSLSAQQSVQKPTKVAPLTMYTVMDPGRELICV